MAKQLNVNLAFSADTSKVKGQLQDLQSQLKQLTMSTNIDLGITGDIKEATKAAAELSVHLKQATNVQTGTLDFTKLNQSITQSGKSLQQYGQTLASMGPKGQQAFMSLAQAVASSEVPIRRTNAMLKEMGTTLANTARWQLSSSILHGFMGAVQSAYGYAQDLNESLNNIRIVTGQNIDQMSRFADEANKAAKALSTTTTEYTNASLIYYQQGLNDQQVKERTDITIKMANVSRQSAEVVSDQMTAVWNNFAKGGEDLEHFADVMTALGAATASSTSEISEGLNKFAAVAETVGLSYEYAASALATVTATTRQSADVVGTAFKTLFARIQDLELGKTLDDGTTLGTYSQALEKVGIDIKTVSGEMKGMDTILQEMAAKWDTLGKDQQVALAQSVAGVRQYTQLIALMDNWDFMEQNLATAEGSTGALQKQADTYAESWEAAQNRVRAAAEGVYDALINDEFFIDMLNAIEKIIGFVDHLIDNLGGLKGVLAAVGAILTRVFSDQIAQGITNMAYNINMMTESGRQKVQQQKSDFIASASHTLANMEGGSSTVQSTASQAYTEQLTLQQKMIDNADKMTEAEQQTVQILMDQLKARGEAAIAQAKELDAAKQAKEAASDKLYLAAAKKANDGGVKFDTASVAKELSYVKATVEATRELDAAIDGVTTSGEATEQNAKDIYDIFTKLQSKLGADIIGQDQLDSVQQLLIKLQNVDAESEDFEATLQSLKGLLGAIDAGVVDGASDKLGADLNDVRAYADSINRTADAQRNLDQANEEVKTSSETVSQTIDTARGKQQSWADILVSSANFAFSAASALNMLGGAFDKLKDPDATGWEKFLTILTTLGMVIPTLVSLFGTFKKLLSSETVAKIANVAATLAQVAAEKKLNKEKGESSSTTKKNIKETWNDTKQKLKNKGKSVKDTWNDAAYKKSGDRFEQVRQIKGKDGKLTNVVKDKTTGKFMTEGAAKKVAGQGAGKALGTAAGGVALIAAGIAVAVGAVKWGISQFEKQAKAAQEAAAQANKAAEAYQQVADAYNSFTSTMDNYSNAKAGLEELTKGTNEYREAVLKANEAAMELINSNEGLQYTVDNDGLIQINEESLKAAQEKKLDQMQNAQISSQLAAQNAKTKQLESDRTDFARESLHSGAGIGMGVGNTLAATGAGAGAGALIGAGIGTIVPVIGNAVGAAVGAIVGGIAGLVTGIVGSATAGASVDPEQQALEKLARVYEKEGNARFADDESFKAMLSEQGITDPLLIQSLTENRQSTMELVAKMAENTAAISSMNEQMVAQEFGDELSAAFDKFYSSADDETAAAMTKETTEAMAVQLEKRSAELYEDEYKDQFGGMKDKDIQKQYAEAMGWDVDKTENKNGNKATYYDKDGNVVAEDLSDEVARQFLAQQAALKELEGSMPFYIDAVQSLANAGNALGEGVGTAIASFAGGDGGNLGTLTQSQWDSMKDTAPTATKTDKDGNVLEFSYNGEVINDEKAQLLGYESAQAFYDAFNSEIKRVENAWAEIELDFAEAGLDPKIVEDLSLEAAQKFQKSLEKMNYGSLGDQGAKVYADGIDMITASVENMAGEVGMGEADVAKFVEGLSDIDWSDWYAMDDVNALLESMGYDLNLTTEEMQRFIETMRQVGGASPVDALRSTWENAGLLYDKLSKGIPSGSILDKETYDALIAQNAELEGQFMQMMDGSYKYVGDDTLDFSNAMNLEETLAQTKEMSELYNKAKADASEINFAGLANMDFVTDDEIKEAQDAIDSAEDAYDKAEEEHSDGFLGIKYTTKEEQADLDSKQAAIDSSEQHLENLETQRASDFEQAQSAVSAVMDSEYLKEVAAYNGWDEDTLNAMLEGIKNGDDASMEQMKVFADQMNKFMAAGDEGLYDVSAAEEKIASMATSIEELDALTEQYSLSTETYAKAITGLFGSAAAEAKSLEELDELKQQVLDAGGEVSEDVYLENVKRLTEESMNAASSIQELTAAKAEAEARGAEVDMELYADNVKRVAEESMKAAGSLAELQLAWSQANETGVAIDYGVYADNLLRLAESYSICADEAAAFNMAVLSGNEGAIKAAEENLEASIMLGEAAQQYGITQEELSIQAKQMASAYGLNAKEAAQLAIQNQRMNKGVEDLVNNWEDWSKELKKGDKTSRDWAKAAADCTKAIANLVGASEDLELPEDFFDSEENMRLLEEATKGNTDAINELGIVVARAQIQMMQFQEGMTNVSGQPIDSSQFDAWKNTLMSGLTELQNSLDSLSIGDNVYDKLGGDDWVNALNEMAMATGMSVEQMQSMLNSMGVQAEVVTATKDVRTFVPEYTTQVIPEEYDEHGNITKSRSQTWQTGGEYMDGVMEVAQINTGDGVGTPIKFTGNGNVSSSAKAGKNAGGGGGGGSAKKTEDSRQRKSEVVDPYKEVNDSLERTNHLMNKNNTLAEGLWGAARSKKIRDNINLQKQEIGLLEDKLAISKDQLNLSRQDLSGAAAKLGVSLDIDESNGIVKNIVDVQEALWAKREALLDSFGVEISDAEQNQLDAFDKYMENFTNAYDEYENHRQTQMQTEEEILEAQLEAQQMMFDDLNKTLEENVSLIEKDLELVEYYLSKVEDDFYGMAEAAALMIGSLSSANPGEGGQLGSYLDGLAAQAKYKQELDDAFAKGEINQAQYIEGLMNCQSAIIEQLSNINELDKTMKGYYGETLAAAQEELSKYTDMMDHHTEVLDHYLNLLDLIGASKDWTRMKTVLQAQVDVAENSAAVSKANYEMLAKEAEEKKKAWEDAQKNSGLSDYEKSVIQQQWIDAQTAANEAQSQMLADAEAWAESLKSLLETELAELAEILEESLSGEFGSLDNMMTAMERASSLQEEYLTTTNQVYETNKLMRTAQQEIDKTTNSVAKRRLKQYIDETEQLQNKNKLSQFELDIQKAKYDLLVAEIALEEAQQAKSTVRLQRDSEGNFGYVYTADQNAIAEAQQKAEDAQNALYNIGLEGANKYAESYAQTIQEMNDAITELTEKWQNGEIASREEYEKEMLRLKEYYGEKLMQYSELHTIALSTDSRVASEAWTKDFAHMTTQTQLWMTNVDRYVQGVEASMGRYQAGIDKVEQFAGLDLISLKQKTEDIKKENDELAKSITKKDGVLDALKAEITQVGDLALKYAALRKEIQGTVDDYEALLKRLGVDIDTAASGQPPLGGDTEDPGTNDPPSNPGTTDPGTTDPGTKTISVGGKINAGSASIYDYAGDTSGERQYFRSDPIYNVLKEQGDWIQVRHHKLSSGITGWFKKSDVTAMNTGGYTGDWDGSYGKLAFLHQKELVLNAQDTENLLASMDILDKIISTIDLYSTSAQLGGMLSSPRYGGFGESESLEQNVHIEASFPGVSDRNEIEEALNNLINRASQYAHRR